MTQFARKALALALATVAVGTTTSAFAVDTLKNDREKVSYMVGMDMSKGLEQIKGEIDIAIVMQAMQDQLAGKKTLLTEAEAQAVRQTFIQKLQAAQAGKQKEQAEKNQKEGAAFLAANKAKAGVKTTASGLQYQVVTEGKGPKPKATDQVKVHYTGTLIDGTKFDSSVDRGEPTTFPLNGVIPGWTEGLQLMPVGSKYKFFIPANLAYGDQAPPNIGPNATLVFDVELLEIVQAGAAAATPKQ